MPWRASNSIARRTKPTAVEAFSWQDFDVGQAAGGVDGDVNGFPGSRTATSTGRVGQTRRVVLTLAIANAFAGAALDAPEL